MLFAFCFSSVTMPSSECRPKHFHPNQGVWPQVTATGGALDAGTGTADCGVGALCTPHVRGGFEAFRGTAAAEKACVGWALRCSALELEYGV